MAVSEFIRPEVARAIMRWREALTGAGAAILGAWWLWSAIGVVWIFGAALLTGGVLLFVAGLQRGRFRSGGTGAGAGPGIVALREGQLAYFGPVDGGVLSVDDLDRIALGSEGGATSWILGHAGGTLRIPVDAAGADQLFDVFAALPGIETEAMLGDLRRSHDAPVVVWERPRPLSRAQRLRGGPD